jgi:hypothetical protein
MKDYMKTDGSAASNAKCSNSEMERSDSNLKEAYKVVENNLSLLKKDFYYYTPPNGDAHKQIYAYLPSEKVPEELEKIDINGMNSFEIASLYASYICDSLARHNLQQTNPAFPMFHLEKKAKDNLNKLKSHLYHQAMLVHVDNEIYLLRNDQEILVRSIFPGRRITSVMDIKKNDTGNIEFDVKNEYYDFTKDDVNKTLKSLGLQKLVFSQTVYMTRLQARRHEAEKESTQSLVNQYDQVEQNRGSRDYHYHTRSKGNINNSEGHHTQSLATEKIGNKSLAL